VPSPPQAARQDNVSPKETIRAVGIIAVGVRFLGNEKRDVKLTLRKGRRRR